MPSFSYVLLFSHFIIETLSRFSCAASAARKQGEKEKDFESAIVVWFVGGGRAALFEVDGSIDICC
jgi:hypothetical protein